MKKSEILNTLFVGIDVVSRNNAVFGTDFSAENTFAFEAANNQSGATVISERVATFLNGNPEFSNVVVAMESTSVYGVHIASFLSTSEILADKNVEVYCLNAKAVANYKKSFVALPKNDQVDAFVCADFARTGGSVALRTFPFVGKRHPQMAHLSHLRVTSSS